MVVSIRVAAAAKILTARRACPRFQQNSGSLDTFTFLVGMALGTQRVEAESRFVCL
jgi:hypothetical protein